MNTLLSFEKVHACGNDFLVLDHDPAPHVIPAICDRHHGVGADGIMCWFQRENKLVLNHYDPDGSRSLCINGTRSTLGCLASQAKIEPSGEVHVEGHTFRYKVEATTVSLYLPLRTYKPLLWQQGPWSLPGFLCDVGNPHFVFFETLDALLFGQIAPNIRHDLSQFPAGTNVHQLWQEQGSWRIRSFERGVEQMTLACGSGMYAAALICMGEQSLNQIEFLPDGKGQVSFSKEETCIILEGATQWVATGVYRC